MSYDFAKAAYLKVEELAKRVAALESGKAENKFVERDLSFRIYCKTEGVKTVVFRAMGGQKSNITISISSVSATCDVTLNGESIPLTGGEASEEKTLLNGENKFVFEFDNAANEWIDVTLTVDGYIEEYLPKRFLSSVGGNYYSYFDGGTFYLCDTSSSAPVVVLYDVKHASANYSSDGIFVAKIDGAGSLTIQRYYPNGVLHVETQADGKFSQCLVRTKYGYVILYAIVGNYVKTGFVEFSGDTALTRTDIRAKEISFRSVNSNDYLLTADIDSTVYLCKISPLDFVSVVEKRSAGKLERARISKSGNFPAVWHYKGGAIMEKAFDGERFSTDGKIAVADEAVMTDDGRTVKRTGNNLTII